MNQLINNLLFSELLQSCITYEGVVYLPFDLLVDLMFDVLIYAAVALSIGSLLGDLLLLLVKFIASLPRHLFSQ